MLRYCRQGETAQNMLGLSTQVPMNYVYLTSGSARRIEVGPRTVTFKRCVPKNFAPQNEFLAILIQAMKSIGEERMTDNHRAVIKGLPQKNLPIDTLEQDLKTAPISCGRGFQKPNCQTGRCPHH